VFSTAGSDGTISFWDRDSKYRLKAFPSVGGAITAADFSKDGALFAYAVGYDWSKGYTWNNPQILNKVVLHELKSDECQPRAPRK
jgi:mRNA export factor